VYFLTPLEDFDSPSLSLSLLLKGFKEVLFQNVQKKMLYGMCVKSLFYAQLKSHTDAKRREYLSISSEITPSWRSLYKPPILKRSGDLQFVIFLILLFTFFLIVLD